MQMSKKQQQQHLLPNTDDIFNFNKIVCLSFF